MTTVADYIGHAEKYGGLHDLWDTAWADLEATDLAKLAEALRKIGPRRKGGDGRTIEVRFSLSRSHTARLIERLDAAGMSDPEIRRYADVSQSVIGRVRQLKVTNPPISVDLDPVSRALIRNGNQTATDSPSTHGEIGVHADSRTCDWCSEPLPSTLRAGAHYCIGGACKQAAYRAREAVRP